MSAGPIHWPAGKQAWDNVVCGIRRLKKKKAKDKKNKKVPSLIIFNKLSIFYGRLRNTLKFSTSAPVNTPINRRIRKAEARITIPTIA